MKFFLDTNIIIYAINGKFSEIMLNFQCIPSMAIVIPEIVHAEIEYGARKSRNYEKTISLYQKFMNRFSRAPFSNSAAVYYGRIRSDLEARGLVIGANDMLIAATVIAENGTLVTHNTREFSRIAGLKLEDWTEPTDRLHALQKHQSGLL